MAVMAWAICAAIAGALCFAVAAALQQHEASAAPATGVAGWRLLATWYGGPAGWVGMVPITAVAGGVAVLGEVLPTDMASLMIVALSGVLIVSGIGYLADPPPRDPPLAQ
ncbi:MAG: hypothetical protein DLM61_27905 [Pseudonocardiales bacterium]|nr:MAG: hypothetical protein DLM61_27905 [Pseudonocardiales bacterium]